MPDIIELNGDEVKVLVVARDMLYAKLVPGHSDYRVERAHQAVLDVLKHGVLVDGDG